MDSRVLRHPRQGSGDRRELEGLRARLAGALLPLSPGERVAVLEPALGPAPPDAAGDDRLSGLLEALTASEIRELLHLTAQAEPTAWGGDPHGR